MNVLYENSLLIVVIGAITALILAVAWLQTGRKELVYALSVVIAVTIGCVFIERTVVTDREAIDTILHQAARAVETNDLETLLRFVHPDESEIRQQASQEFPKYQFRTVNIKSNLEITVDPVKPDEAVAKFNVVVIGSHRDQGIEQWHVPRYVVLRFRKDGDVWRVTSYEHHDPQVGLLDKKSP